METIQKTSDITTVDHFLPETKDSNLSGGFSFLFAFHVNRSGMN